MAIFLSPSSFGYLLASFIMLFGFWKLKIAHNKSKLITTKYYAYNMGFLGAAVFFYGAPVFFFADSPLVLGWFNVIGNFFLGVWSAYLIRFSLITLMPRVNDQLVFYGILAWTIFLFMPINIIYLPQPMFNQYGLEIWNYHPLLLFVSTVTIFSCCWFVFLTMMYRRYYKGDKDRVVLQTGLGYFIGSFGGVLVTFAATTSMLTFGYLIMFIGGFVVLALNFLK